NDPATVESKPLKVAIKPVPGQSDVVLYLAAHEFPVGAKPSHAVWYRPRLEGANKPPLLLRDYAQFGPQYEVDFPALFGDTGKYLTAAAEAAGDRKLAVE